MNRSRGLEVPAKAALTERLQSSLGSLPFQTGRARGSGQARETGGTEPRRRDGAKVGPGVRNPHEVRRPPHVTLHRPLEFFRRPAEAETLHVHLDCSRLILFAALVHVWEFAAKPGKRKE